MIATKPKQTLESIREESQREYNRLLTADAAGLLEGQDAYKLHELCGTLNVGLDEFNADKIALQSVASDTASIVPDDDIARMEDARSAQWDSVVKLRKQIADLQAEEVAAVRQYHASTLQVGEVRSRNADAKLRIHNNQKARPRAFGNWI